MSEEELINLIRRETSGSHIEVCGIIVSSGEASLKETENTINRLINKHKDFILMKKMREAKTGYYG